MAFESPIDLFRGWPASHLIPSRHLKEATAKALSDKAISDAGFGYGPDDGYYPLRHNIAEWLTGFYAPSHPTHAIRICITGGASQNLASILQVFTDPLQTESVWLVEPTYHLVFQTFQDAGFYGRMKPVPEDEMGMDVHVLEKALETFDQNQRHEEFRERYTTKPLRPYRKIYKHVIYCVPSFSNPSGTVMSVSRREALVSVARKHDALIISDDVYDFLSWTMTPSSEPAGNSIQRLVDIDRTLHEGPFDRFGNVVSNGSFSKLIGPGCRVGWAEGTESFIYGLSQAGQTRSGGAPSQLTSTFINELLENNFIQQHISTNLVPEGRRRYSLIASVIVECLVPLGVTFSPDPKQGVMLGGYYIWVKLPAPLNATQVCQKAREEQNLELGHGELFAVPGKSPHRGDLPQRLRLCFMWEDEERLVEGVNRLALIIKALLENTENSILN